MPRPKKYRYSKADAVKVRDMAALKMSINSIAAALGMHPKACARYYEKEIEEGKALGIQMASETVMAMIKAKNLQATMFYLNTVPEWNAKKGIEISGPDGGPIEVENDNSAIELLTQMLDKKRAE